MTKPGGMSRRDRRALVIGAFIVATTVVTGRGVTIFLRWQHETDEELSVERESLSRATAAIALSQRVDDSARVRGARIVALAPVILSGDTPATASATLAGIVSGAAARANVRVGALQLHADTASRTTFVRVDVRGEVTGDIAGISAMLASLEGGPTLLAVRELSITQPETSAPADRPEALRVELTVQGLMLRASGSTVK